MTTKRRYLLDANVLIARVFEAHTHHRIATEWFSTAGMEWALSPIAEAAFMRFATDVRKGMGNISIGEATAVLEKLTQHPGYRFHPLAHDWRTLTKPFFKRLQGHKQVMDSYLLGQAILDDLVLATLDNTFVHLAGEYDRHVYILKSK